MTIQTLLAEYWYVAAALSAVWSIGSVVWSLAVERRLRALRDDLHTQSLQASVFRDDLTCLENYLEKTPTSYFPIAIAKRVRQ